MKSKKNMSLDVNIIYPTPRKENYFLNHPYIYDNLSKADMESFWEEDYWNANTTHNHVEMASHIPITLESGEETTLYRVVWRPEELGIGDTTSILPYLIKGLEYMISHRIELLPYNPENGWGSYDVFMKFLLNYKQACEDNPGCVIRADR